MPRRQRASQSRREAGEQQKQTNGQNLPPPPPPPTMKQLIMMQAQILQQLAANLAQQSAMLPDEDQHQAFPRIIMEENQKPQQQLSRPVDQSPRSNTGGFKTSATGRQCFNCGQEGHFANGCPSKKNAGQTPAKLDGKSPADTPHDASYAANQTTQAGVKRSRANAAGKACFSCGQEGHFANGCPS